MGDLLFVSSVLWSVTWVTEENGDIFLTLLQAAWPEYEWASSASPLKARGKSLMASRTRFRTVVSGKAKTLKCLA